MPIGGTPQFENKLGEVQATPTADTLLRRLKDLLTGIALAAGTAVIGKVRLVTAAGDEITDDTQDAIKSIASVSKTVQTELLAVTAIAANVQQASSTLTLAGMRRITIFLDHARDAAAAFVAAGTEYRVEVSEKASGDDTWRTIASAVCGIAAASSIVMDAQEAAGSTRIETGATLPAVGDIVFFKNATIANSEWSKVIALLATAGSEYFDILDGLTNIQPAITLFNKAEQFVLLLDIEAYTRLRVIVNNNNGSTNQAIVSRVAAITTV